MLKILQNISIDKCYIRAIKAGYKDASCVIKVNNKLSAPFKVTKGLKQGCCLSSTLFKM